MEDRAQEREGWMLRTIQALQRPVIALSLTGLMVYLALMGHPRAIEAAMTAFALLAGALYGERAALKVPGQQESPRDAREEP